MMDAITVGKWQGKLMLLFSCLDISLNSRELWQNTDFLTRKLFLWASLVETLIYKISINLSKARRSFSWDVSDWKLHCQDTQICIFHISSISHVCPGHDIEERAFCWNPGTFDLNLGCEKIEWESFINVTYQEVLFSFLCKVKKI